MELPEYELVTHSSLLYTILFILVFVLIVTVNVILLVIFIRNPVLITPTQLLYINLSCSNITLALFAMTFGVVTLISGKWIFPDLVCHLVGFFNNCFIHMVLFTAFSALNERYHDRMSHRRHDKLYTTRRVGMKIGVFWLISVFLSVLPFVPGLGRYTYHSNIGICSSPATLLGILPTITNFIYLVLWVFITFNLATLPRISLPDSLKHKRSNNATFLPQLLVSGVYTVAALTGVIFVTLKKVGVLPEGVTVSLERATLLITYSTMVLIPTLVVVFSPDLRLGLKEVFLRKSCDMSKYEQIEQLQPATPEFSKNTVQGQVFYPDKNQMMMIPPHVRAGYARPVYTRPVRYDVYRPTAGEMQYPRPTAGEMRYPRPAAGEIRYPRPAAAGDMRYPRPTRPVVQRSHSTLGYVQRQVHPVQRSQSLTRITADKQTIEMCTLKQSNNNTPRSTPRSEPGTTSEKTAAIKTNTATSSVASSSTVADIVDL